jgi:hypothetical protein
MILQHTIDVVGVANADGMTDTVTGEVRIYVARPGAPATSRAIAAQIEAAYRRADKMAYTLLTGKAPPKNRKGL